MNHLIIQNLSKTYPNGVQALNGLSLEISNGIFGLLGPNGAGKSTFMRTLATLQRPDEGDLLFNGTSVVRDPQFMRKQLGYLPQEFGVYPGFSACQLLEHLAILKGVGNKNERKEQVEALLQQTNLYAQRKRAVSTYSGGMRQRFGIAQALLGNPQLVIVDEPTAGLDPEERNRFLDLLSEVGEKRIVILSTHIVEDIKEMCRQLAIMHAGSIVLQGSPHKLIGKLEGRVWQKMMTKAEAKQIDPDLRVLSSRLYSGRRCVQVLSNDQPLGYEPVRPDLEQVYFSTFFSNPNSLVSC